MPVVNRQTGYEIALVQNVGLLKENSYLRKIICRIGEHIDIGEVKDLINREWGKSFKGVFAREAKDNIEEKAHEAWQKFLGTVPDNSYLQSLRAHKKTDAIRILLIGGGGGMGDALLYTPVIAELKKKFSPCEITFYYKIPVIEDLCRGNEFVDAVFTNELNQHWTAMHAVEELDFYDLLVVSPVFFPRYIVCKDSRLARDELRHWVMGNNEIADMMTKFASNFGSNLMDRMVNLHHLDIMGIMTGLPIRAESPLHFAPDPQAITAVKGLNLPAPYVTVRDGANGNDIKVAIELGAARANKQITAAKWQEILGHLKRQNLHVVQVGAQNDPPIQGVDRDLRSKTSLSELCFIMKNGVAHIDTEGGLIHFARTVHKPSVAMFVATSSSFFGYPQNANVYSPVCNSCFYADRTWMGRCPRHTEGPVCATTLDAENVVAHAVTMQQEQKNERFQLVDCEATGDDQGLILFHVRRLINAETGVPRIAFVGTPNALHACQSFWPKGEVDAVLMGNNPDNRVNYAFVDLALFQQAPLKDVGFGSLFNIPLNSDSYDVALAFDVITQTSFKQECLGELFRLVRPGGLIIVALDLIKAQLEPTASGLSQPQDRNTFVTGLLAQTGTQKHNKAILAIRRTA